jgi:hypothetical protein
MSTNTVQLTRYLSCRITTCAALSPLIIVSVSKGDLSLLSPTSDPCLLNQFLVELTFTSWANNYQGEDKMFLFGWLPRVTTNHRIPSVLNHFDWLLLILCHYQSSLSTISFCQTECACPFVNSLISLSHCSRLPVNSYSTWPNKVNYLCSTIPILKYIQLFQQTPIGSRAGESCVKPMAFPATQLHI